MIEISEKSKIGVLGGGSWATAIMKMLVDNTPEGEKINWYVRTQKAAEFINENKHNPNYLSAVKFNTNHISVCSDMEKVVLNSDILILAIPSAFLGNALKNVSVLLENKFIVSAVKGIEAHSNMIIAEYLMTEFGINSQQIGVITGPCHAEEVAMERLSYLTIVAEDLNKAAIIANKLDGNYIKTILSDDLYGTEYAAVLKNVYALAVGISHGLGYGDNFISVLIAKALQETKRFIDTVHPIDRDIKDSAYLGDLLVTAYSKFSRNRTFGLMIGKGYSVKTAQLEMNMIAEGYYATESINKINSTYNIFMPIAETVYNILYKNRPAAFEFKLLTEKLR